MSFIEKKEEVKEFLFEGKELKTNLDTIFTLFLSELNSQNKYIEELEKKVGSLQMDNDRLVNKDLMISAIISVMKGEAGFSEYHSTEEVLREFCDSYIKNAK